MAKASGEAQQLETGLRFVPTSFSAAERLPPHLSQNAAAAFYAGQRMTAAPSTLPLYIKLLNGQQGGQQAAELQFGAHRNVNNGNFRVSRPGPLFSSPFSSQGQQTAGFPQTSSPVLPASSSNEGQQLVNLPQLPELLQSAPHSSQGQQTVVVPQLPEQLQSNLHSSQGQQTVGLAQSPSASTTSISPAVDLGYAEPVDVVAPRSDPSQSAAPETPVLPAPLEEAPQQTEISGEPQATSRLGEPSEGPSVVSQSFPEVAAVTANSIVPSVGKIQSDTSSSELLRHMPSMYKLPLLSPGQKDGHYIIVIPNHKKSLTTSAHGKTRSAMLYLASNVRPLSPHHHSLLDFVV